MNTRKSKNNDCERIKCRVLTAFIALHETFNDLMLYKDVSESTDLCFKKNNVCSTTFDDFDFPDMFCILVRFLVFLSDV